MIGVEGWFVGLMLFALPFGGFGSVFRAAWARRERRTLHAADDRHSLRRKMMPRTRRPHDGAGT